MDTVQEQFDALIAQFGAEAVVGAIKGHVSPDGPGGCPTCPKGYICNPNTGNCVLDVG